MERGKSAAVVALLGLVIACLWQVAAVRSATATELSDKSAVAQLANEFAVALTTYDYAHPDVQRHAIATVSTAFVQTRVLAALPDEVKIRASSIGTVRGVAVTSVMSSQAEVLVQVSQIVTNAYVLTRASVIGWLQIQTHHAGGRWLVTDYGWLVAVDSGP